MNQEVLEQIKKRQKTSETTESAIPASATATSAEAPTTGSSGAVKTTKFAVWDHTTKNGKPVKFYVTVDSMGTIADLLRAIVGETHYTEHSITIAPFTNQNHDLTAFRDHTLAQLGLLKLPIVIIKAAPGCEFVGPMTQQAMHEVGAIRLGASRGDDPMDTSHSSAVVPYTGSASSTASSGSGWGWFSNWSYSTTKSSTGYVGLANQGATCYMNSLIQSLFMTPEFRRAVYNWSFEDKYARDLAAKEKAAAEAAASTATGEQLAPTAASASTGKAAPKQVLNKDGTPETYRQRKERLSIPLHLQKLFLRLQTSEKRAVQTKGLTKSFGWNDAEAFTQHDVQELCRVLFDALEENFTHTDQANLINKLWQGKMKDYVKCLECGTESARQDTYLDIALDVKGFGQAVAVKSIQEALAKYIQPEILEGRDQYSCEKCHKKVNAKKGLAFVNFPYFLMLQLKRFTFDFATDRRVKLNDRVVFPLFLDINDFLEGNEEVAQTKYITSEIPVFDPRQERPVPTPERPYVYELYAILIHRGSALGGHYYAYIKAFDKNKWFEFNDSTVVEISFDDIEKSFGQDDDDSTPSRGGWFSAFKSGANAYMLMYRRIDPSNQSIPTKEDLSPSLLKQLEEDTARSKAKAEKEKLERETYNVRIYFKGQEKTLSVHKSVSFRDALMKAAEMFGQQHRPLDCIRVRQYQPQSDVPLDPLNGNLDEPVEMLKLSYKPLLLEVREPDQEFPAYDPNLMALKIALYKPDTKEFVLHDISVQKQGTVATLNEFISEKFGIPTGEQLILQERLQAWGNSLPYAILSDPAARLRGDCMLWEGSKLYVERHAPVPDNTIPTDSACVAEIERARNLLNIKIIHIGLGEKPDLNLQMSRQATLEELKGILSTSTGIPADDMKLSRGTANWRFEMKDVALTLEEHHVNDGQELFVERGRPLKPTETIMMFYIYTPESSDKVYDHVFNLPVDETRTVLDLKRQISEALKAQKNIDLPPETMRLRDMYTQTQLASKVLPDSVVMKNALSVIYSNKPIAIQRLPGPEPVTTQSQMVLLLQKWNPSTFTVGPRVEVVVPDTLTASDLRRNLAQQMSLPELEWTRVGLAKEIYASVGPTNVLDIPELQWDRVPAAEEKIKLRDMPMFVRDGDVIFYRDNTEKLKVLTPEEKSAIQKELAAHTPAHAVTNFWGRKETALKIHTDKD
ncbi:5-methyltetrahydropteroyltriglutamate--homocysteine S-methyltransferase [Pelomyxa schiedti]|nr:5-methyltetrahydropteroyltriglutamate--homocysteine S-methyltransferase [Pelomyxa schiedti]